MTKEVKHWRDQIEDTAARSRQSEGEITEALAWKFHQGWNKLASGRSDVERQLAWESFESQARADTPEAKARLMRIVGEFRQADVRGFADRVEAEKAALQDARAEGRVE